MLAHHALYKNFFFPSVCSLVWDHNTYIFTTIPTIHDRANVVFLKTPVYTVYSPK